MFPLDQNGLRLRKLDKFQPLQRGGGGGWVIRIFFMLLFSIFLALFEIFNEQDKGPTPHFLAHSPSLICPHG